MKKMVIYTVSTSGFDGNFMPVRAKVKEAIDGMGLSYNGYDSDTFVQIPGLTATENCIRNMDSADGFVVLLNPRYGYIEKEHYDISVTHAEIDAVMKSKKPYIVLANAELVKIADRVPDADSFVFDGITEEYFGNDLEGAKKQIELIKQVMSKNVIGTYTDNSPESVAQLVRCKFEGLAPLFVSRFVSAQSEKIHSDAYHDAFGCKIKKRVPVVCTVSGSQREEKDVPLNKALKKLESGSVVFEGESGAGKSFSLKELLVKYSEAKNSGAWYASAPIPIYLDLSKLDKETFAIESYLSEYYQKINNVQYDIPPFVLEQIKAQGIIIFADNFEEWEFVGSNDSKRRLLNSLGGRFALAITTSALDGFRESFKNPINPCAIIRILGWDLDSFKKHALSCLSRGRVSTAEDRAKVERLAEIIKTCEGRSEANQKEEKLKYYSPFIYNMVIQSLGEAYESEIDIYRNQGIGILLRISMQKCIVKYARANKELTSSVEETVRNAHKLFSATGMFMFEAARDPEIDQNSLGELREYLERNGVSYDRQLLRIFFHVRENHFYPKHMLIVYYYVAEAMLKRIVKCDFEVFSRYAIPSEVNRMIRDFLKGAGSDGKIAKTEMAGIFEDACKYLYSLSDRIAKLRMYYFVPSFAFASKSFRPAVIEFLKRSLEKEKDIFHKVPIVIWLAQLGDVYGEGLFYKWLDEDVDGFEAWARGCHLVYQTDRGDDAIENFLDMDGNTSWPATAKSFVEHFHSNDERHLYTRRTDLRLMIAFVESGKDIYPDFEEFVMNYEIEKLWTMGCSDKVLSNWRAQGLDIETRKRELAELLERLRTALKKRKTKSIV